MHWHDLQELFNFRVPSWKVAFEVLNKGASSISSLAKDRQKLDDIDCDHCYCTQKDARLEY